MRLASARHPSRLVLAAAVTLLVAAWLIHDVRPAATQSEDRPATPVEVENTPLPVSGTVDVNGLTSVQQAPAEPVTARRARLMFADVGIESAMIYTVPEGKRLWIDHVSARIEALDEDESASFELRVNVDGFEGPRFEIPMFRNVRGWVAGQQVQLFADQGSTVHCDWYRNIFEHARSVRCTISGHLVDM